MQSFGERLTHPPLTFLTLDVLSQRLLLQHALMKWLRISMPVKTCVNIAARTKAEMLAVNASFVLLETVGENG